MNTRKNLIGYGIGFAWRIYIAAAGIICLGAVVAPAQEALDNMTKGDTAAYHRDQQMQDENYTVKAGDFSMLLSPEMAADWNDNVNLSDQNRMDDYILKPGLGVIGSYQLTQRNLLFLDVNLGYWRYLKHPSLSSFEMDSSTGTGLSFDIGIKDVTLNLHDWISYVQNASQSGQVANTANYGTFQNTLGLSANWELNKAGLSAGYDHQIVKATSSSFESVNHSAEMFFLRPSLQLTSQVTVGLDATATLTTYEQNTLNNNDAYTLGAFTQFVPGQYFQATLRGGYSTYKIQNTSSTIQTSDHNSWYVNLNLNHKITDKVSYTLDSGHEIVLGTQSDLTEIWYARPSINWDIIKDWSIRTGFFYENGNQGVGNVAGNLNERYQWYGGDLNINRQITRCLSAGFSYRLTLRSSDVAGNDYSQNIIGVALTYQIK